MIKKFDKINTNFIINKKNILDFFSFIRNFNKSFLLKKSLKF